MPTVGETWYTTNAKWRTLSRNDWGYAFADDVVIRYVDVTDARLCESVLDYIATIATFAGSTVITDGQAIGAAELWVTHFVRYETITLPNRELGYRIQHALRPQATSTGDGAYIVENNCTFRVSWTFYWRVPSIIQPVTAGTSGITYAIQGVSRDRETGDYSYVIEKREQLTTHVAEHRVSETDFETVYEQQFLGVRESSSGSGVYTKDHTGAVISALWDVHDVATVGTRYTQNISKNANCTADVTQRKTVAKANVVARQVLDHDQFRTVTATQTNNQATADVADVAPANGKVTRKEASHNGDGTSNNTKTEEQEHEVDDAVKREVSTAAETVTEVENSGKAAVAALPVSPTEGTLVEVVNTKTKGGWFIQRIITRIAQLWESRFVRVSKDLYEVQTETHSDAVATADLPADPPAPSAGVWYERFRIKRPDRKYDVREVKHEEQSVASAKTSHRTTIYEQIDVTDSVDATALGNAPAVADGKVTQHEDEKTPGGIFRRRKTESTVIAQPTDTFARHIKRVTPFIIEYVKSWRNQAAMKTPDGLNGERVTNDYNDHGKYDVSQEYVEKVAADANGVQETHETLWEQVRQVITTIWRGRTAAYTEPTADTNGEVIRVRNVLGDDGLITSTYERDVAIKRTYTVLSSDVDGPYRIFMLENYTTTEVNTYLNNILVTYGADVKISPSVSMSRYPNLVNATLIVREANALTSLEYIMKYSKSGTETIVRHAWHDGVLYKETYSLSVTYVRNKGVSGGTAAYLALNPVENFGSQFRDLGRDWYWYRAVTAVTLVTSDITADYVAGSSITYAS